MSEQKIYEIVRFFQDPNTPSKVIHSGLTKKEVQEHCSREDTHGKGWFDGWREE